MSYITLSIQSRNCFLTRLECIISKKTINNKLHEISTRDVTDEIQPTLPSVGFTS